MTTQTKATMAGCVLLALYSFVWFHYMRDSDNSYYLVHKVGRPVSAGDQAATRSATEISPNALNDTNQTSDVVPATADESHPQEAPTLQYCTAIRSTTVVPTAHRISVTETELRAQREIETEPVPGQRHIIFLETRCVLNVSTSDNQSGLVISKREACAVASAANTNPDTNVYLLYTCPIVGKIGDSPEYVKQMLSYPNVRIWKLVVSDYFKGTPLDNWDFMAKVQSSRWPVVHASDILRYTTLWKYGGTYLDLDFVMQKSLTSLGTNYVGAQSEREIANGALNFDMDAAGRTAAHLCLTDIQRNFNGHLWVQNGPWVIHRVLQTLCGTERLSNTTREQCAGFAVLPPSVFYAISYPFWTLLFDEAWSKATLKTVEGSFGVHMWNKMSSQTTVTVGSQQAYGLLAQKHCPRVYSNCGPVF